MKAENEPMVIFAFGGIGENPPIAVYERPEQEEQQLLAFAAGFAGESWIMDHMKKNVNDPEVSVVGLRESDPERYQELYDEASRSALARIRQELVFESMTLSYMVDNAKDGASLDWFLERTLEVSKGFPDIEKRVSRIIEERRSLGVA